MYFINIKQLKQDIINKDFTEKDRFIYAFIYIVIYSIFSELSFLGIIENENMPMISDYMTSIGTVLITIIGTYFLYKANGGNDGEDFLGRYFSITWVMVIRLLPLILIMLVGLIITNTYSLIDSDVLDIVFVFFGLLYDSLIYYYSYGHMTDVSKKFEDES